VADSNPEAEYEETLAKAADFLRVMNCSSRPVFRSITGKGGRKAALTEGSKAGFDI
jgi:hypothetical protein